jgi:hypothetical protein
VELDEHARDRSEDRDDREHADRERAGEGDDERLRPVDEELAPRVEDRRLVVAVAQVVERRFYHGVSHVRTRRELVS